MSFTHTHTFSLSSPPADKHTLVACLCVFAGERSVAENLKLFDDMRKGKFAEGKATLRMKVPLSSCVYSGFSKCLVSLEKMESKPVHSRCTCEWAAGY